MSACESWEEILGLFYNLADVGQELSARKAGYVEPPDPVRMFDAYACWDWRIRLHVRIVDVKRDRCETCAVFES